MVSTGATLGVAGVVDQHVESEPELTHAIVDVGPQLTDIIDALVTGYATRSTRPEPN